MAALEWYQRGLKSIVLFTGYFWFLFSLQINNVLLYTDISIEFSVKYRQVCRCIISFVSHIVTPVAVHFSGVCMNLQTEFVMKLISDCRGLFFVTTPMQIKFVSSLFGIFNFLAEFSGLFFASNATLAVAQYTVITL